MAERFGAVWYEDRLIGVIRVDRRGLIHFRYTPEWLADGFPVSLSIPLSVGDSEVVAHGFFEGLLPEGASRIRICRELRLDVHDDAGLLLAIGEDCAGALSITPDTREPPRPEAVPRPLSMVELEGLVRARGRSVGALFGRDQRFSLAGAQEKLPVCMEPDGGLSLPTRACPSTHVLKFETIRQVCFAEYAALDLARRLGLVVVDVAFHRLEGAEPTPYLLIQRYDRWRDADGQLHRLHQEDLIQALGYETAVKYEEDGGPELGDVARLLRDHVPDPLPTIHRLIDWQLFNVLAGNFDGHGKNLALLYPHARALPRLASFYDLVSIAYLNTVHREAPYSQSLAFRVGGEGRTERLGRGHWEAFARSLGVRPRLVERRLRELAQAMPGQARAVRAAFAETFGDNQVYDRFEHTVSRRCAWFLSV